MSKTLGFYLLEKRLRAYRSWPIPQWFKGIGTIILIGVNTAWAIYPTVMEFKNYKTNLARCIFRMEFIMLGLLVLSGSIQGLWTRNRVSEMIDLLSDFNQFGIPQGITLLESKLKTILKIMHYGGFLIGYLMVYCKMLEENCANFKNMQHCSVIAYYVPFNLKPWKMTLIMLFQIHTVGTVLNIIYIVSLLYWYSLELLVVRIENLKDMLDNIHLSRNKKRNYKILRPVIMYHQDIFRMFQFAKNLFTNLVVPQKIFAILCLSVCTTEFVLRQDLLTFFILIMTWLCLLLNHAMGQRLITAGNSVTEAVYNMNWYDADISTRKDILTFLIMSQKEFILELPLLGEMSNTAAALELKKVYVFFNSLLKISKKINFK